MTKASEVLLRTRKKIQGIEKEYLKSVEFQFVAFDALRSFILRVRRSFMPGLGSIPALSKSYITARKGWQKGQAWFYATVDLTSRQKRSVIKGTSKLTLVDKGDGNVGSKKLIKFDANVPKLSDKTNPTKSNATATGQMLESMEIRMKSNGFTLFVPNTKRDGSDLTNSQVANLYSEKRNIFEFSEPELKRIIRNVKSDLLNIIRRLK